MCLFPGMAVVLLFTILFAAGYTTPAIGNVNTVQQDVLQGLSP